MVYDYSKEEFWGACREKGGRPHEPEEEIWVCDFGDHELTIHSYLDPREEGSAVLHGGDRGTDWRSRRSDVTDDGTHFIMENAEGNPGPHGGMPMHVDDAEVKINEYGVDAQRVQKF